MANLFRRGASPETIVKAYESDVKAFKAQRTQYLIYK